MGKVTKKRIPEIDIMKGIAILCVMIGHTTWRSEWLAISIYSFHMPLFFIISGYFAKTYSEHSGNSWTFIKQNARQLLVPFIVTLVISCLYVLIQAIHYGDMSMLTHKLASHILAWDTIWEGTLFDHHIAPIWFLLALFWGRILFYWLSRLGKWLIPLCILLSVAMILVHPYVPTPFGIGRGIEALMFIAAGWAYKQYRFPLWVKIAGIACWIGSIYMGSMDMYAYNYSCMPINIIGACGGTLMMFYVSKGIARTFMKPFFAWCGRNSLVILCAHSIESTTTVVHMAAKVLPFKVPLVVYFGVRHAITLLGAWLYEKVKSKS